MNLFKVNDEPVWVIFVFRLLPKYRYVKKWTVNGSIIFCFSSGQQPLERLIDDVVVVKRMSEGRD